MATRTAGQAGQTQPLYLYSEIPIRLPATMFPEPGAVDCDDNGFLYFRVNDGGENPLGVRIAEVSPTGYAAQTFSLSNVPDLELRATARGSDFGVTGAGALDLLTRAAEPLGPRLDVIEFAANGRYQATVKLSQFFVPRGFALLPGGGFFVFALARDPWAVMESSKSGKPAPYTEPIGAFFDSHGQLRREINLPGAAVAPPGSGTSPGGGGAAPGTTAPALVAADYDGTVYVAREDPPLSVYVISDTGTTVDSIKLQPPVPQARLAAITPAGPERLAVEFQAGAEGTEPSAMENAFSIVNTMTGDRVADYRASTATGGKLGCYARNGFELLARDASGKPALRFVTGNPPPPVAASQDPR